MTFDEEAGEFNQIDDRQAQGDGPFIRISDDPQRHRNHKLFHIDGHEWLGVGLDPNYFI
jgi:hypothetical protein